VTAAAGDNATTWQISCTANVTNTGTAEANGVAVSFLAAGNTPVTPGACSVQDALHHHFACADFACRQSCLLAHRNLV
jgi:hypothetical protein